MILKNIVTLENGISYMVGNTCINNWGWANCAPEEKKLKCIFDPNSIDATGICLLPGCTTKFDLYVRLSISAYI